MVAFTESAKYVNGIREYWESDHWKKFLHYLQEKDGEKVYHIHHWMDTSIHPESLQIALQLYFAHQGWEVDREIDTYVLSPMPVATLHGVCAKRLPHFDINFRYNPDVILAPMGADFRKDNCEAWGESYMKKFHAQFDFRSVGQKDHEAIEAWFHSPHWERACHHCEDPKVVHIHVNVVTSVHPDAIIEAAKRAFKREGWTLWDYTPCIFNVRGVVTGKIVFMLSYPQQIFDICWRFDPEVVLAPSPKPFMLTEPEFDVRTQADLPAFLAQSKWAKLTRAELRKSIP
jgi:hypothetical protein